MRTHKCKNCNKINENVVTTKESHLKENGILSESWIWNCIECKSKNIMKILNS